MGVEHVCSGLTEYGGEPEDGSRVAAVPIAQRDDAGVRLDDPLGQRTGFGETADRDTEPLPIQTVREVDDAVLHAANAQRFDEVQDANPAVAAHDLARYDPLLVTTVFSVSTIMNRFSARDLFLM